MGLFHDHACLRLFLPGEILPVIGYLVKLRAKQGEVGRDGTSAREISFVSFMAYGPHSDSALTMVGYSL